MQQNDKQKNISISKTVKIITFVWILILGGFFTYVLEVNSIATKGFSVSKLEKDLKSKESEYKYLTSKLSESKEIKNIQAYVDSYKMIKVAKVEYINLSSNVAMK